MSDEQSPLGRGRGEHSQSVPAALVAAVLLLTAAPFLFDPSVRDPATGRIAHGVLEWSAVSVSLFTAVLGFLYLWARRDFLVAIVAVAAVAAATWDAFHAVASIGLVAVNSRLQDFVPLSSAASRTVETAVLTAGAAYLLLGDPRRSRLGWIGLATCAIAVVGGAWAAYSLSLDASLPTALFPEAAVKRPWDLAALGLLLIDGLVLYPLLVRRFPSLLAKMLWLSVVPAVFGQLYLVFGSAGLYDRPFFLAHFLKIVASIAPLSGICLHLVRSYRREMVTAESMEKLVTELRTVEDQLRSKEMRLDQLTTNIKEVFWIAAPNGKQMHYVSPAYEEIFGLSCNSLYQDPASFLEVVHPEDSGQMIDLLLRNPEHDFEVDYRISRRDGETRWLRTRGFPIRNAKGAVYRVAGITEDVTDRKSAEEELRKSEARTRALLRAMPDLMFRVSRSGVILDYHASPTIRLYKPPSVFLGARFSEVMPELGDSFQRSVEEALASGVVHTIEYRLEIDGHVGDYEARFAPSTDDEVLMVVRDVTEEHRLQKEILNVSHREQERIGHDLHDGISQQLTGIALLTKALQQRLSGQLRPEAERARQIAALVEDTLSQTKSLARGLAPVELEGGGIASALEDLARGVETIHGVRCSCRSDAGIEVEDTATAIHVYRIAQEAVNNAIRHGDPNRIHIDLSSTKGRMRLAVEDDGRGIESDDVNATDGMGLHIMRYRSRMIDGTLQVGPRRNKGTRVSCEWPRLTGVGGEALGGRRRTGSARALKRRSS